MTYTPTAPPALPGTLGDIVSKVRRITKSPSQNQITDEQIVQYINTYYLYDFPAELRLKDTFTNWTFTTSPYQETYPLPTDTILTVEPPLYINGYQSFFTQSQDNFYQLYPLLGIANNIAVGNGTTGPYTFQLTNYPIIQRRPPRIQPHRPLPRRLSPTTPPLIRAWLLRRRRAKPRVGGERH